MAVFASLAACCAASAFAGEPTHLRRPALDISGLDHACGVAVDSSGNRYVASAGAGQVKVFSPSLTLVATILDSNEPCGLAVNSNGDLFVSEAGSGNVVRFRPNAYPLGSSPSYGAAEPVDSSGAADGIAVDPFDDRLYVAEGTRVSVYDAEGNLGIDEVQTVTVSEFATGGTFTLSFEGQTTGPLSWNATHAQVQTALEALASIGSGNVSVGAGPNDSHLIQFAGTLSHADLPSIIADPSGLVGEQNVFVSERTKGFDGRIGEGEGLTQAIGVAAYSYVVSGENVDRYLVVTEGSGAASQVKILGGGDIRTLRVQRTIGGPIEGEDFEFGSSGAYPGVDPGNSTAQSKCEAEGQACTAGHWFVFDAGAGAVEEFDASGEFLDRFGDPALQDAEPSAVAVDRSGGSGDGTLYVTSGPGLGAAALAFGPLAPPSRALEPTLSKVLPNADGVAIDSHGDLYLSDGVKIRVYGPGGGEITSFGDPGRPIGLAVDSTGKVYVLDVGSGLAGEKAVSYYTPSVYPPTTGVTYGRHEPPVTIDDDYPSGSKVLNAIAINPANDHLFVSGSITREFNSAANGSGVLNSCFACGQGLGIMASVGVYGRDGSVYLGKGSGGTTVFVVGADEELRARIVVGGGKSGLLGTNPAVAVDQKNGHVVVFSPSMEAAREYEASGSFVAEFGKFTKLNGRGYQVAIDPTSAAAYVAYDDTAPGSFDLTAFGPLAYGEPPLALTGIASEVQGAQARLNGTVNPHGFDLTDCHFEYLTEDEFQANEDAEDPPFNGATPTACVPDSAAIGKGEAPVAVHADLAGLQLGGRYRFRLVAENEFGPSEGAAGVFGPPVVIAGTAQPVLYGEANLRASLDPAGLSTEYHFEYGPAAGEYNQSTPVQVLPATAGPTDIAIPLVGLTEGTTYHFRLVAVNEDDAVNGDDRQFTTLVRPSVEPCANVEYRIGLSAALPDCRAYELVTPAETNGLKPKDAEPGTPGTIFNNWLTPPRGELAGERLSYFTEGTLPGFDGNGKYDGYTASRATGTHPAAGWQSELTGPTFAQASPGTGTISRPHGVSSDQQYFTWHIEPREFSATTLPKALYLTGTNTGEGACASTPPSQFELLGCGSLGIDLEPATNYISAGGGHIIFSSAVHLEPEAPPAGTGAIYDRAAGSNAAEVVSLQPGGAPFGTGQSASYVAASDDGAAVVFSVGSALYLHVDGQTLLVTPSFQSFDGLAEDGDRLFYTRGGGAYTFDVAGSQEKQIAAEATFVNVSSDGSRAYLVSEEDLGGEENEAGQQPEADALNLYAYDVGTEVVSFVARLASADFTGFGGGGASPTNLGAWSTAISPGVGIGRAYSPTRSTPTGGVLVFQSHARLTAYDNGGRGEIYRYDPAGEAGERLLCVSCDPSGVAPTADAMLELVNSVTALAGATTVVEGLTDDGRAVFFHSPDRLLPEDANSAIDVYEWKVKGAGGCTRDGGCLALISSGQGEGDSYLFAMSADGRDVFFQTAERLLPTDRPGSPSIYDARVEGGIPAAPEPVVCEGDACQGAGAETPRLLAPASTGVDDGNLPPPPRPRCRHGKHRVKGRCVPRHRKQRHSPGKGRKHGGGRTGR